jgi:hypothetical protein
MKLKELYPYEVYVLTWPKSKRPFYCGVTTQPLKFRLTQHISETKNGHGGRKKYRVMKGILDAGKRPGIAGIDRATAKNWEFRERWNIKRLRKAGYKLTNTADGGKGQRGTSHTAEVRRRIAASVSRARQAQRNNINIPSS